MLMLAYFLKKIMIVFKMDFLFFFFTPLQYRRAFSASLASCRNSIIRCRTISSSILNIILAPLGVASNVTFRGWHAPLFLAIYPLYIIPKSPVYFCLRSEEHTSELQSRGQLVCRL